MPNLIGQTIGQYRIMEQIGRGGMATVYKAFQPAMERNVAIKILPEHLAEDPHFIERFRQEAKAIAQLEHPHILPVYDYGEEKGLTYMVMRYLDSGTLTARLKRGLEVAEVVRLLGQVAEALDYTHSRGIVHRDIKPSNVLIDSRGETLLTDFGIAKMVEGTAGLTGGAIVGTPTYMSPEQAQGRPVDGRSDIYSLGVILYEALIGRPPFEAETPMAVLMKHVSDPLPLPRTLKPEISEAMEQVILKALAKNPADRYQTAGQMKQAMATALTAAGQGLTQFSPKPAAVAPLPPSAPATLPATPGQPEPRRTSQLPLIIGGGLVVLLLGIVLAGWSLSGLFQNNDVNPSPTISVTTIVEAGDPIETTETPTERSQATVPLEPTGTSTVPAEVAAPTATDTPAEPTATSTPTPTEPTATLTPVATIAPAMPPTSTPEIMAAAVNVTNNPDKSDYPALAVDGADNLHLAWWDKSTGKLLGDILYRQRSPEGVWSEAQILSQDFTSVEGTSLKLIRDPKGQICTFWEGSRGGLDSIGFYRRCLIGGEWTNAEMLRKWGGGGSQRREFQPIFTNNGAIQTVYLGGIHNAYFEDIQLSDGIKVATDPAFALAEDGSYHVVWVRQGTPFSIEYRSSNDGGQTWQEAERLTDDQNAGAGTVGPLRLIANSQGNVHLVFVSQNKGIFYRQWTPAIGWGPSVELTQGKRGSSSTSIGLTSDAKGLAHVIWHGFDGVFYTQQQADETWSKPRLIADTLNTGAGPEVAVDDKGARHFVWQVENDAVDLYYANLP